MVKVKYCGVRRSVVLSSSARCGSIKAMCGQAWTGGVLWRLARLGLSWRGRVLSGRAQYGEALHCKVRHGSILAWLGLVRSCPDRQRKVMQSSISACPALYGTVLSCPVRQRMARFFEVWSGMAVWGSVRLGQVLFGSVELGKVRRYFGMVVWSKARFTMLSSH